MRFLTVLFSALLMFALPSHAAPPDCDAAREGTIIYNKDSKLVQFCNGTDWIGMVAQIGGTGDTLDDLSCQNDEVPVWNGAAWVCGTGGGDSLWSDSGSGYLIYDGEKGVKLANITGMAMPTFTIGDLGCSANEILKWDGTNWSCAADDAGALADNAVTNAKMADDAVGLAELSATGTASATTYLRGDNTWATISGADNLGNHTATQALAMGGFNITNAGAVTGTSFTGVGTALTALNATNLASGTVAAARMPALTGDVTMTAGTTATNIAAGVVSATELADDAVTIPKLAATGTADGTTFLRGDNTWSAPPAGGSVPAGVWCGLRQIKCDNGTVSYPTLGDGFLGGLTFACGATNITGTCAGDTITPVCPSGYVGTPLSEKGVINATQFTYTCRKT